MAEGHVRLDGGLGRMLQVAFLLRLVTVFLTTASFVVIPPTVFVVTVTVAVAMVSLVGVLAQRILATWATMHPTIVLTDVLITMGVVALVGIQSPLVLATLTTAFIVGLLLRIRFAVPVVVAMVSLYLLAVVNTQDHVDFLTISVVPLMYVSLFAIGGAYRHSSAEQARSWRRVAEVEGERSTANERVRLAREMHDSLAKTLHGIAMGAAALPHWVAHDRELAIRQACALAEGAEQAADEARAILVRMRADQPDRPLAEVLSGLCQQWAQDTAVPCTFEAAGIADISHDVRYQVMAVAAEALENVRRHAQASSVFVELGWSGSRVQLVVRDDGVGLDADRAGRAHRFGLRGMAERAREVGGDLTLASQGCGTELRLTVPPSLGARTRADHIEVQEVLA